MPGILVRPRVIGRAKRWNKGKATWTLSNSNSKPTKRSVAVSNFWRSACKFSNPLFKPRSFEPVDADLQAPAAHDAHGRVFPACCAACHGSFCACRHQRDLGNLFVGYSKQ